MSSPWLSFSGTGSAPRASTQQGTMPLSNWYGANHRRKAPASSAWPRRMSATEVSEPSRIQERA